MRWSQVRCFVLGLVAYVHGVSVVLSGTPPTTTQTTTSCALTQFDDIESRTVVASLVVDAVVDDLRRIARTSSGVVLYRARLTVIHVLKGRLGRPGSRPRGLVTIAVGTFARTSRRAGTTSTNAPNVDELCASFDLPVNGSRYIMFLQPPSSSDARASSHRPHVYSISSSPEQFSASKLDIIRRCTRRRYALAAKVRVRPRDVTLLTGQRLRLRCRTFGRPQPSVTWYKDGHPLQPDRHVKIKSNRRGSRLQISEVMTDDAGTYECQGRNVAGPASSMTSSVQIRDPESTTKAHVRLCTDQSYCLNGGTCYVIISLQRQLCECKASFQGQRCRERVVVADISPVVAKEKSESSLLSFLAGLRRSGNARFVRRTSGSS